MNVVGDMDDRASGSDPIAEAERWFVRLRTGGCLPEERAAFDRWQRVPAHAAAYAQTQRLWDEIGGLAGDPVLERMAADALAATVPRRHGPRPGRWRMPMGLAAAAAGAAIAIAVLLPGRETPPTPIVHATDAALRKTVALADGSEVVLDVDTEIIVRFTDGARDITLRQGQALFDVAHDADRPFRVTSGGGQVVALGTRFEVDRTEDRVEVTLLQGSVSVERSVTGERVRLWPNEQAAFAVDGGPIATRAIDPEVASSWTRGRLLFRGTPLSELVAEVNRYADRPLRLADPTLGTIPVSGTFPIGDSRSVALGLQALLPVRADLDDAGAIELQRR